MVRIHLVAFMIDRDPDRILVRFNTKWKEDPAQRKWRVLVNRVEYLASDVRIGTYCETIEEPVNGEMKFHFLCLGRVHWNMDSASIQDTL